ncbi:MAG: phosphate ABC transporter permease PstA [Opitutales bacterium]
MDISTRKVLDKVLTYVAYGSLATMIFAIVFFLAPIMYKGVGAVFFKATVEHDKFLCYHLNEAQSESFKAELKSTNEARAALFKMMADFEHAPEQEEMEVKLAQLIEAGLKNLSIEKAVQITTSDSYLEVAKAYSNEIFAPYREYVKSIEGASPMTLVSILTKESEGEVVYNAIKARIAEINVDGKISKLKANSLARNLRNPVDEFIAAELDVLEVKSKPYDNFKHGVRELLGPETERQRQEAKMPRQKYGQPRLDNALKVLDENVLTISVTELNEAGIPIILRVKSKNYFAGTKVEEMISYIENNFDAMLNPHYTFYWGFFFDNPVDSNIFGGIYPMILGTFYLTLFSMLIAAPLGMLAAIYFAEYAKKSKTVAFLEMCVGTLAGVPSIVFGLFGLAFIINTIGVSDGKSVIAGSITLALLILPTIIRSSIVALQSVPHSYREASLGLGASKWKSIVTVILPAALPSMLTGIIISMGRAAGETAPIIFTAATSTGAALGISEIFSQPTTALPWNIYNMCAEHELADRVVHVQYGMVLTLITIVLALNFIAIYIRARLQKRAK